MAVSHRQTTTSSGNKEGVKIIMVHGTSIMIIWLTQKENGLDFNLNVTFINITRKYDSIW